MNSQPPPSFQPQRQATSPIWLLSELGLNHNASAGLGFAGALMSQTHTLSVLVENSPGVLARVASLFSRRGYNIDSLAVGPTENPDISRMTIVIDVAGHALEQVIAQLDKLINVISITQLDPMTSVQRELLLVKVSTTPENRSQVLETVQLFRAKVVDVAQDAVTIEATGNAEKIQALLRVLEPYGIKELVQSGLVAMERGLRITEKFN